MLKSSDEIFFPLPDDALNLAAFARDLPVEFFYPGISFVVGELISPESLQQAGEATADSGWLIAKEGITMIGSSRNLKKLDFDNLAILGRKPSFVKFNMAGFGNHPFSLPDIQQVVSFYLANGYRGFLEYQIGIEGVNLANFDLRLGCWYDDGKRGEGVGLHRPRIKINYSDSSLEGGSLAMIVVSYCRGKNLDPYFLKQGPNGVVMKEMRI